MEEDRTDASYGISHSGAHICDSDLDSSMFLLPTTLFVFAV